MLETVTSFKNLCSVTTDENSKPEILCRIAQTTAALTRLKPVWIDRSIYLSSKIRLMHSLVTSIFLYACESWALTAELQRRIQVYCNSLLAGCPKQLIHKLQKVQNNAARLICRTPKFDHISPVLHTLHWLPIWTKNWIQTASPCL